MPLSYRGHETGWKEKLMRVMFAGGVVTICLASGVVAQVRDRSAVPAAAPRSDADAMAAGWTAAARGQVDVALKEADSILTRRPWDRGALMLKINALAAATPLRALDVYERWIVAGHGDDAGVLEPVAIGVLNEIANGRAAELKRPALRALAAARVTAAQRALDALAPSPETQAERDIELARSGDPAAAERLNREAAAPESATPASAKALSEIGLAGEPGLLLLLKSRNPQTRSAAAEALGQMESERAREPLKALAQDVDPVVRISATVSLAQLGDSTALSAVNRMLASDVPDIQLTAARAWKGRPGPWVAVVKALLANPDGLTRIEAAQAIAPVDPEAARRVLGEALSDTNPVIRYESATSIERVPDAQFAGTSLAILRQRLRDADPSVRLAVASILLKLARA
ncbi:MAG TPA: HEAT repeat domain-containing protein [Vicinamibacterales bacterium]